MQAAILGLITLGGISLSFWGVVGSLRFVHERVGRCDARAAVTPGARWVWGFGGGATCALPGLALFYLSFEAVRLSLTSIRPPEIGTVSPLLVIGSILVFWMIFGFGSAWLAGKLVLRPRFALVGALGHGTAYWFGIAAFIVPAALETNIQGGLIAALSAATLLLTAALSWIGIHFGVSNPPRTPAGPAKRLEPGEVAAVIPAHNEEKSIGACLEALGSVLPMSQVYVGSDGSSDRTVEIARRAGCAVEDIQPNRGKAQAIKLVLDKFDIVRKYKVVLILDADSEIDKSYLRRALPLFDDPRVAAVAGHVVSKWKRHAFPRWSMLFVAYRVRLYALLQAVLRFGQTWEQTNVSFIIPGFASMYRTEVLPQIDITAPGLIIEDFNMTFELQKKRLGSIAYSPCIRCLSEDPHGLRDYVKQLRRWNLGFWQTVRRHGIWASGFWASLGVFTLEVFVFSLFIVTVPVTLAVMLAAGEIPSAGIANFGITLPDIFVGLFLADYMITVVIAVINRKWILLVYGLAFIFVRWIDGLLFLYTFVLSWFVKSDGRWASPNRW